MYATIIAIKEATRYTELAMQIDKIIQMAKDHILKHGEHLPEIIVEFATQEVHIMGCPDITNSDESLEKQHRFFTAGRMLGEENPGKDIAHIAFAVEAWIGRRKREEYTEDYLPSKDPNRKECLIVVVLDIVIKEDGNKYLEQHCYPFELIRDGSGKLVDLLPWNLEEGKGHSKLLTAFLAGFVSTQISKEERDNILAKTMGPDATGEEVRKASKQIFERKMYMADITPSVIPRKRTAHSYGKAKKKRR